MDTSSTGSRPDGGTPAFPFIVGVGRSGTTLVRAILDTHPAMAIPGESHFIPMMAKDRRRYEGSTGFRTDRFLTSLTDHPRFRRWPLPAERVTSSFRSDPPVTLAEAIRRVYALFAEQRGKSRYGDKTPAYLHHMLTLADLFPESRFVHLVRDGRDVALSRLDHPTMSGSVLELAMQWKRGVEKGRLAGRRLGPQRYMEIRYETLVEDPEGVTGALCSFLELEFDHGMLRYHERADEIIEPTQHPQSHGRIHLPPTRGLRDWRSQMAPSDIEVFDVMAGGLLKQLGYERGGQGRALGRRLSIRRRQIAVGSRRALHRMRKRMRPSAAGR